ARPGSAVGLLLCPAIQQPGNLGCLLEQVRHARQPAELCWRRYRILVDPAGPRNPDRAQHRKRGGRMNLRSGLSRRDLLAFGGAALVLPQLPGLAQANLATQTPMHGISPFGDLKYGPDFQHLDYVNPDAPKG